MNNKAIKIFDLVKEIMDILSTMNQDELKYLKLKYDIAFKSVELTNLKKKLKGSDSNEKNDSI
jgi:hypothetical protein